jgi:hypothetical protein
MYRRHLEQRRADDERRQRQQRRQYGRDVVEGPLETVAVRYWYQQQ